MNALWIVYPFCSIFIIIGAGISVFTLRGILKARDIRNWPTVEATILECDFESNSGSETTTYRVNVRYEYSVLGRKYESDKIHPNYSSSNFEGHRPLFERLEKSTIVTARYNEADPSESYLLAGTFSAHMAVFFGGMIFLSAGIFFLLTFHFAMAGSSDYASALEVIK